MLVLVIGGARHGEFIKLPDGAGVWVNLVEAASYPIRKANSAVTDFATGKVKEAYVLHLAVHPDLVGPQEPAAVGALLNALAMNEFARTHGEPQEIPEEPAIEVPEGPFPVG